MSIAQSLPPENLLDLGLGDPAFELLPLAALDAAAARFFAASNPQALQYGNERGHPGLRRALAAFLAPSYGAPLDPDGLFICHGASGALDLLCTLYTRPGDVVLVEEPSYFLALRIFTDHGLHIVPMPLDAHGLDVDAVEAYLRRPAPSHAGRVAMLYTIPTHQNPSGRTLPAARRRRLAQLSAEFGFMLAADEVYHLLSYNGDAGSAVGPGVAVAAGGITASSPTAAGGPRGDEDDAPLLGPQVDGLPAPAFSAYAQYETVVSIGSFSKILAPGVRTGWVAAHPQVIARLAGCGLIDSGGGLVPFMAALLCELLESGALAHNVRALRRAYRSRRDALHAALQQHAPWFEYDLPRGGFFIWPRLAGVDSAALRPPAQAAGVDFRPGARFSPRGHLQDCLRLCFAFYDEARLSEAARRLGAVIASHVGGLG